MSYIYDTYVDIHEYHLLLLSSEAVKRLQRFILLKICLIIILFLNIISLTGCKNPDISPPVVKKGVIDLRGYNFSRSGTLLLNGEWKMYWKRLLTERMLKKGAVAVKPLFVPVPGIWNDLTEKNPGIGGTGFATYNCEIILPPLHRDYGLHITDMATAYRLWVNGHLLASNGTVGTSSRESRAQYLPKVVLLPAEIVKYRADSARCNLVIQVSNFEHKKGGIWESLRFGPYPAIREIRERSVSITFFIVGVILIMSFYHFGMFITRRNDPAPLYFAIFSFLMAVRSLVINERMLIHWFPSFPWELFCKIEYISSYCNIMFVLLFVCSLYPKVMNRIAVWAFIGSGVFAALLFTFFPIRIFSVAKPLFDVYILLCGFYILIALFWAGLHAMDGAWIAFLGMLVLYLTGINDVLYNSQVINTTNLAPFGLFIFIISQSYLLAHLFSKTFKKVEVLTGKLTSLNMSLEEKVEQRTIELQEAFDRLELTNNDLTRAQESMNSELELARRIQEKLIPAKVPESFGISSLYKPMEKIGGDIYDYIHFREDNRLGIFMGDVSGHGVPAALITSMAKSFILQAGIRKENPAELLEYLNKQLLDYAGGNFITAFYCIIDPEKKVLTYANAGHNYPYLISNNRARALDKVRSLPLGIVGLHERKEMSRHYENYIESFPESSKLVLYTDGLIEARNLNSPSEYFGDTEFVPIMEKNASFSHKDFIGRLYKSVIDFQGNNEFEDDICVICVDL